jgi:hypothetical protein
MTIQSRATTATPEPISQQLEKALKEAQTGFGSYGANYDGAKLAQRVQEIIRGLAATPAPATTCVGHDPLPEGWEAAHPAPWGSLTKRAQAEKRYSVKRLARPFCDQAGNNIWFGPTLAAALANASEALRLPAPVIAQPTDEPKQVSGT